MELGVIRMIEMWFRPLKCPINDTGDIRNPLFKLFRSPKKHPQENKEMGSTK